MTNELAIDIMENEKPHCGKRITFTEEEKCEAFDIAINAIKQTDILDRIMAEIHTPNRGTCDYFIVDRIERIINEYRKGEEV